MENVPSFLDFLATHTAQRIPLRSDAAVSSMVHQIEDRARRLRGTMPLLFCAGEPEWPGFGVAAAVDPRSATMAVTIRDGVIAAEGLGWTARVHDRTWPEGDRLVLAYAGDDYGAVLVSRAAPLAAGPDAARSYAYWSYDSTVARLACIWVGTYLARPHVDTALRWNAGVNAIGDHRGGEMRRLLRRKRVQAARNAAPEADREAGDAGVRPRLGDDIRAHGVIRGRPPRGW